MKFVSLLFVCVMGVSCKMGAPSGGQTLASGKVSQPQQASQRQVLCESNSEKSGTQIFEKAVITEKGEHYEIVYDFTTKVDGTEKHGKEVISGKRNAAEKFVSTDGVLHVVLEDSNMVVNFEEREVAQKFDKLLVKLENGKLHLSDNEAVVLELSGCRSANP